MKLTFISIFAVIAILGIVFGPLFTIRSLNLLFHLEIQENFHTWLAAFWLMLLVGGAGAGASKSK